MIDGPLAIGWKVGDSVRYQPSLGPDDRARWWVESLREAPYKSWRFFDPAITIGPVLYRSRRRALRLARRRQRSEIAYDRAHGLDAEILDEVTS